MDPVTVYALVAAFASLVAVLLAVFGVDDAFGAADSDVDVDGGDGLSPLSPVLLVIYLAALGFSGTVFSHVTTWGSVPVLLAASATSFPVYYAFYRGFKKFLSGTHGVVTGGTLVGREAVVSVPMVGSVVGSVTYTLNGSEYSSPARCKTKAVDGDPVRIVRAQGTILEVEKLG